MRRLRSKIALAARHDCTVLIQGESGTGKELVARELHLRSARSAGPFVPVDCTTLTETLFESQLFGHVKGAFTGADRAMIGFFRASEGGTLFLDEVGDLRSNVQARLLRCLETRAVVPVGAVEPIPVNVRVVAATHHDLPAMIDEGAFREDLFYRLNVLRLDVPPLRRRRTDIIALAEHFLADLADLYEEPAKSLSPAAVTALEAYSWPGNVRELANALEHGCVLAAGNEIEGCDLPDALLNRPARAAPACEAGLTTLANAERELVKRVLYAVGGNQSRAARVLRIDRHRLSRMIRRHGLEQIVKAARAGFHPRGV
jgi:DNA-binding NtrC family response regulator